MQRLVKTLTTLSPPPHLSASSIGTFNQCNLKFKYNKIDLIQDDPTEATLLGNFVHDVLEAFYAEPIETRTASLTKEIASHLWNNGWGERVAPWVRDPDKLRIFRWNAWWCIENLWKIEEPQEVFPAGLEHEVNGLVGGVRIKGFIDRFSVNEDSTLTISDYKTGKVPKPHFSGDKFFQLQLYAYLLKEEGRGDTSKLELLYLKEGKRLESFIDKTALISAETVVVKAKTEIDACCESGNFTPTRSVLCDWCSYKTICPVWNKK
jgi:putative RecB family exonuclease